MQKGEVMMVTCISTIIIVVLALVNITISYHAYKRLRMRIKIGKNTDEVVVVVVVATLISLAVYAVLMHLEISTMPAIIDFMKYLYHLI